MFTNQDIIAIIFRLINFAALVGGSLFLFKKHVMPDLLLEIEKKKNAEESLFLQQAILEKQQRALDTLLKKESLQCEQFRLKIDEWKRVVAIEANEREKERNDIMDMVNQRIAHNAAQKEQVRIQKIITKTVVTDLEKSLSSYFKEPQQGTEYLSSILQFMNERVS